MISYASVLLGAACYLVYVRKERGHLVHVHEWTERLGLLKKQK